MASLLALTLGLSACAANRPALQSNEHLTRVGAAAAERDIDECIRRAEAYDAESRENARTSTAANTATGAAVGAAGGGAGGAVVGQAARGAAVGAAGGAAASLTASLMRALFTRREPRPAHRELVNRCLREKGYDPR